MKKEVKKNVMSNNIVLNVAVENDVWFEAVDFDAEKVACNLKDVVFEYVASLDHELLAKKCAFSLNVCLSDDEAVHKLNKEFRGMDKPTNVLSFANIDDDFFWDTLDEVDEAELGDIILAFETLVREAQEKNISVYAHYCHLLVHGFLHLLGFDHQEDEEAEEMENLEVDILASFSIDNPYKDIEGE